MPEEKLDTETLEAITAVHEGRRRPGDEDFEHDQRLMLVGESAPRNILWRTLETGAVVAYVGPKLGDRDVSTGERQTFEGFSYVVAPDEDTAVQTLFRVLRMVEHPNWRMEEKGPGYGIWYFYAPSCE